MRLFETESADQAWKQVARHVLVDGRLQPSRAGLTREVRDVLIGLTQPTDRAVYSRPINPAFAIAEVIWILAGADDSSFLKMWNPRMANFVDPGENRFHGAYGNRLGAKPLLSNKASVRLRVRDPQDPAPVNQLLGALNALRHAPESRQVVLQVWDKNIDLPDPFPRSRDVPCNLISHLLVRDGALEWIQVARSTDLVWGLPYNLIQWTSLQEVMAGWLGLDVGRFYQLSGSLHAYEKHWEELPSWIDSPNHNASARPGSLKLAPYQEWEAMFSNLVDIVLRISDSVGGDDIASAFESSRAVPAGYREWIAILSAEAFARCGLRREAQSCASRAGLYWESSWKLWDQARGDRTLKKPNAAGLGGE